jgi:2-oxoisovalerate dehydrogenase E2 component (dihydrolipoyl transacylase)
VPATGPRGRVLKGDVLNFLKSGAASAPAPKASKPAVAPPAKSQPAAAVSKQDTVVPVKGIQKAMVKSMKTAWSVPHFGYSDEIVMDALINLRGELKDLATARGVKFSYMPIIIKVCACGCSCA